MRQRVLLIAAFAALGLFLTGCGTSTKSDTSTVSQPVRRVIVEVASGDVKVTGTTGNSLRLHRSARVRRAHPRFDKQLQDGVLRLTSRCNAGWFGACRGGAKLGLRDHTEVEGHSASGNVRIDRAAAAVDVTTGSGSIDLVHVGGVVRAHTGSGKLTVDHASDDLILETGSGAIAAAATTARRVLAKTASGKVQLVFSEAPDEVDAQTGSGDIEADVPKGAYQVDTGSSGGGSISVKGLDKTTGSDRHVRASTGSGSIKITGH